jgi:glycerol-3-phosphate acyltransferase PlsY
MLALAPVPTAITVAAWVAVVALTKRSSLGALTAVFLLPLLVSWFEPAHGPVTLLIALGVAWRHTDNIKRLLTGTEP